LERSGNRFGLYLNEILTLFILEDKMKISNLTTILSVIIITLFIFSVPASGDDALYIDENGKVGMGTSYPLYKLHLQADSDPWPYGGLIAETVASNAIGFNYLSGHGGWGLALCGTGANNGYANAQLNLGADGVINFLSGDGADYPTSRLYIASSGDVGIGTSYPGYGLNVYEDNTNVAIYAANVQASTNNYAVYATTSGAGSFNYGIYAGATDATTNYAGYFYGDVYGSANASFDSVTDRTPFYEGDALSAIAKISGKDGEIDHSTLPDFAHIIEEVPVFEESELTEISPDDAFEAVMVERAKLVETTNDKGNIVKSKIKKGVKTESRGYKIEDGKIIEIVEEIPVYETETIEKTKLRKDVYFDERTGKVYQKIGDGVIFEKDGKIYQRNQTGIEVEDQRDLGAMISILTVAIQQQQKEIEELKSLLNKKK